MDVGIVFMRICNGWVVSFDDILNDSISTSPTDVASKLTIFSWGTATTLWLFISMMR